MISSALHHKHPTESVLYCIDCVYAFHFVIKHLIVISTHSIPDTGLTAKLPSINKNIHEYMLLLQMQITLIVKH